MKRTIAIFLSLTLLLCAALLAGCTKQETPEPKDVGIDTANWTEAKFYSWVTVKYDEAAAEKDGLSINALDGSWWVSFNFANSDSEFENEQTKYAELRANETYTDLTTVEKTLGSFTYQASTYTANGQFFGAYFAELDPAIAPAGGFDPVKSISVKFFAEDPNMVDYIDAIIGTLNIIAA